MMMPPESALTRTNRVWPHLFGDGHDTPGRRQVAAQAFAQDLRDRPDLGLSAAEEPERHAFGIAYVRLRREIEGQRTIVASDGPVLWTPEPEGWG